MRVCGGCVIPPSLAFRSFGKMSQVLDVKDIEIWSNTKLQAPWSAAGIVTQIDAAKLAVIVQVFSKGRLDQLVKIRLLIACALLPRKLAASTPMTRGDQVGPFRRPTACSLNGCHMPPCSTSQGGAVGPLVAAGPCGMQ